MKHRHLNTEEWTRMAIASLFERGERHDWEEFVDALRNNKKLADETLVVCSFHEDIESANLARVLVASLHGEDRDLGLR